MKGKPVPFGQSHKWKNFPLCISLTKHCASRFVLTHRQIESRWFNRRRNWTEKPVWTDPFVLSWDALGDDGTYVTKSSDLRARRVWWWNRRILASSRLTLVVVVRRLRIYGELKRWLFSWLCDLGRTQNQLIAPWYLPVNSTARYNCLGTNTNTHKYRKQLAFIDIAGLCVHQRPYTNEQLADVHMNSYIQSWIPVFLLWYLLSNTCTRARADIKRPGTCALFVHRVMVKVVRF